MHEAGGSHFQNNEDQKVTEVGLCPRGSISFAHFEGNGWPGDGIVFVSVRTFRDLLRSNILVSCVLSPSFLSLTWWRI